MASQPGCLRLLVVENDELIKKIIEEMLGVLGHEIVGRASTATAAVAEAETTLPDVVLMDVKLDGVGDGIDAAYAIKNRLGIRSLLLTGTTDSATRARSVLADPIDYLHKPVTLRDLAVALGRVRSSMDSSSSYVLPPADMTRRSISVSSDQPLSTPRNGRCEPMAVNMSPKAKREEAARARRLALSLGLDADRQRLLAYADELDRQAIALEWQADHQEAAASAMPRPGDGHDQRQHPQQQQQQQQSEAPPGDDQGAKQTPTR